MELYFSGYLYLSMSNYFCGTSLGEFGKGDAIRAKEEADHAKKIIKIPGRKSQNGSNRGAKMGFS